MIFFLLLYFMEWNTEDEHFKSSEPRKYRPDKKKFYLAKTKYCIPTKKKYKIKYSKNTNTHERTHVLCNRLVVKAEVLNGFKVQKDEYHSASYCSVPFLLSGLTPLSAGKKTSLQIDFIFRVFLKLRQTPLGMCDRHTVSI